MTLASILVVDADDVSRAQIAIGLREFGHNVSETENAVAALAVVNTSRPDLLVCDFSLPDLAGVELLNDLRARDELRAMRVLMTSDGGQSNDVVSAFESGADDFVRKPIDMPELLARVNACLQRPANVNRPRTVDAGGISIDTVGHRVSVKGQYVSLAPREYRLLLFMVTNRDRVFSRKQLLAHVWDRDTAVGSRTVDVHIRRLRSVLEPFESDGYLQTVRGSGYRFSLTS